MNIAAIEEQIFRHILIFSGSMGSIMVNQVKKATDFVCSDSKSRLGSVWSMRCKSQLKQKYGMNRKPTKLNGKNYCQSK